ncbi:MAG: hypothetical protein OZ918_09460 [Nitrospirales bacterium]|nr:hypothetical protein [Nitrospirales bacterium]
MDNRAKTGSTRIVIMGAAGRDFHNFNVLFRDDPAYDVVAFTAAQIPNIQDRTYPPCWPGPCIRRGSRSMRNRSWSG